MNRITLFAHLHEFLKNVRSTWTFCTSCYWLKSTFIEFFFHFTGVGCSLFAEAALFENKNDFVDVCPHMGVVYSYVES